MSDITYYLPDLKCVTLESQNVSPCTTVALWNQVYWKMYDKNSLLLWSHSGTILWSDDHILLPFTSHWHFNWWPWLRFFSTPDGSDCTCSGQHVHAAWNKTPESKHQHIIPACDYPWVSMIETVLKFVCVACIHVEWYDIKAGNIWPLIWMALHNSVLADGYLITHPDGLVTMYPPTDLSYCVTPVRLEVHSFSLYHLTTVLDINSKDPLTSRDQCRFGHRSR